MEMKRILAELEEIKYALIGAVEVDEETRRIIEERIREIEERPGNFVRV